MSKLKFERKEHLALIIYNVHEAVSCPDISAHLLRLGFRAECADLEDSWRQSRGDSSAQALSAERPSYCREIKLYPVSKAAQRCLSGTAHLVKSQYIEIGYIKSSDEVLSFPFILAAEFNERDLPRCQVNAYFCELAIEQGIELKTDLYLSGQPIQPNKAILRCSNEDDAMKLIYMDHFIQNCEISLSQENIQEKWGQTHHPQDQRSFYDDNGSEFMVDQQTKKNNNFNQMSSRQKRQKTLAQPQEEYDYKNSVQDSFHQDFRKGSGESSSEQWGVQNMRLPPQDYQKSTNPHKFNSIANESYELIGKYSQISNPQNHINQPLYDSNHSETSSERSLTIGKLSYQGQQSPHLYRPDVHQEQVLEQIERRGRSRRQPPYTQDPVSGSYDSSFLSTDTHQRNIDYSKTSNTGYRPCNNLNHLASQGVTDEMNSHFQPKQGLQQASAKQDSSQQQANKSQANNANAAFQTSVHNTATPGPRLPFPTEDSQEATQAFSAKNSSSGRPGSLVGGGTGGLPPGCAESARDSGNFPHCEPKYNTNHEANFEELSYDFPNSHEYTNPPQPYHRPLEGQAQYRGLGPQDNCVSNLEESFANSATHSQAGPMAQADLRKENRAHGSSRSDPRGPDQRLCNQIYDSSYTVNTPNNNDIEGYSNIEITNGNLMNPMGQLTPFDTKNHYNQIRSGLPESNLSQQSYEDERRELRPSLIQPNSDAKPPSSKTRPLPNLHSIDGGDDQLLFHGPKRSGMPQTQTSSLIVPPENKPKKKKVRPVNKYVDGWLRERSYAIFSEPELKGGLSEGEGIKTPASSGESPSALPTFFNPLSVLQSLGWLDPLPPQKVKGSVYHSMKPCLNSSLLQSGVIEGMKNRRISENTQGGSQYETLLYCEELLNEKLKKVADIHTKNKQIQQEFLKGTLKLTPFGTKNLQILKNLDNADSSVLKESPTRPSRSKKEADLLMKKEMMSNTTTSRHLSEECPRQVAT